MYTCIHIYIPPLQRPESSRLREQSRKPHGTVSRPPQPLYLGPLTQKSVINSTLRRNNKVHICAWAPWMLSNSGASGLVTVHAFQQRMPAHPPIKRPFRPAATAISHQIQSLAGRRGTAKEDPIVKPPKRHLF